MTEVNWDEVELVQNPFMFACTGEAFMMVNGVKTKIDGYTVALDSDSMLTIEGLITVYGSNDSKCEGTPELREIGVILHMDIPSLAELFMGISGGFEEPESPA